MNEVPTFEECLSLCERETAYSHSVQTVSGKEVHSFKYNLQKPFKEMYKPYLDEGINALALRGITFIDGELVALGPDKFFNQGENEIATFPKEVEGILEKIDGSLIQVFLVEDQLEVKTQKSVHSDVANHCREYFKTRDDLRSLCRALLERNMSPYFEFVSDKNRIVLDYGKTDMYFLGARNMDTGATSYPWNLYLSESISIPRLLEGSELESYLERTDVEGVVVIGKSHLIKMKTDTYCQLHRVLDIRTNKHMCEHYQSKGGFDDAIGLLSRYNLENDIESLKRFEQDYLKNYNDLLLDVEDLWVRYTGTRKEVAIAMNTDKVDGKMRALVFLRLDRKDLHTSIERILFEYYRALDK
jgi:T4 RnlA family RNA ligase